MLEVREQVRLSFRRMLDICLDSIAYRLLRSLVTVVIIVLAIAFLASIMVEGYLGRALRDTVRGETARINAYRRFLAKAGYVEPDARLIPFFAGLAEGSADFRNLAGWLGGGPERAAGFVAACRRGEAYLAFFDGMPAGRRVILVQQNRGTEALDWLANPRNWQAFEERLRRMASVRAPGGLAALRDFLAGWPAFRDGLASVRRAYAATVARIAEFAGPDGLGERLSEALRRDDSAGFFARLAEAGFEVDQEARPHVIEGLRFRQRLDWAVGHLRKPAVRNAWNREFQEKFSPLQALRSCADTPARADWIRRTLAEKKDLGDFDRERFLAVARDYRGQSDLLDAEQRLLNRYGGTEGLSEKTMWLIFVSFLVCVVGIANAMLMSVLERFKEIATMKCLGARNQTIAFLFVTESTIMGVIGGSVGMVVGFLIVLARQGAAYGGLLFRNFPVGDMATTMGVCFACSLLLATVAAIYPARVAARMAPMEAMRVD